MVRVLARGFSTVVAADAIAADANVIEVGRQPACGRVAIVTSNSTRNMGRVFARCCNAVMTGAAATEYLRVIHPVRWCELIRVMAVLTDI